jgi:hypothetical protein
VKVRDVVILREVADDLNDGKAFYDQSELGVGDYFWDSLFADIESLIVYGGIHGVEARSGSRKDSRTEAESHPGISQAAGKEGRTARPPAGTLHASRTTHDAKNARRFSLPFPRLDPTIRPWIGRLFEVFPEFPMGAPIFSQRVHVELRGAVTI